MAEQLVKTTEQIQEEVLNEETDTKLETKSAVWNGRINLELTRRTMRKTEKKVVESGREVRKIDIDEDTERETWFLTRIPEKPTAGRRRGSQRRSRESRSRKAMKKRFQGRSSSS
jgi:hypothetical protein